MQKIVNTTLAPPIRLCYNLYLLYNQMMLITRLSFLIRVSSKKLKVQQLSVSYQERTFYSTVLTDLKATYKDTTKCERNLKATYKDDKMRKKLQGKWGGQRPTYKVDHQ